jgi:hypothetical protein
MEDLIRRLDWSLLEKHNVFDKAEADDLLKMVDIDPDSTLTKMRSIFERIVDYLIKQHSKSDAHRTTDFKTWKLSTDGFIPKNITIYLNVVRIAGNSGIHPNDPKKHRIFTKKDVYLLMPIFVHVIEWFIKTVIEGKKSSGSDVDGIFTPSIDQALRTKIDSFIDQRVELVRSSNIKMPHFGFYSERILFHLIPLNPMDSLNLSSPEMKREMLLCYPVGFSTIDQLSFNAEGLEGYSSRKEGERFAVGHVQVFKDGTLESVSCIKSYTDYVKERNIDFLRIESFEADYVSGLGRFLNIYSKIGIHFPVLLIISLVNFCNFKLVFYKDSKPYYEAYQKEVNQSISDIRKITFAPMMIMKLTERPEAILRPVFDHIWNMCGFTHSLSYDVKGNWDVKNIVPNFEKEDQDFYSFH